jgi:hypothetical protein
MLPPYVLSRIHGLCRRCALHPLARTLSAGYAGAAPCTRSGGPALLNLPLGAGALPPDPLAMISTGVDDVLPVHAQEVLTWDTSFHVSEPPPAPL